MASPPSFGRLPRSSVVAALVGLVALAGLVDAGCTSDPNATDATTDTTVVPAPEPRASDDPLAVTAYADPATPITAAVGERFALLLDAEPTEGYRWEVVSQGDPAVVLPLGSQFVARSSLPSTTTTTAPAPPVPEAPPSLPPEPDGGPATIPPADAAPADDPSVPATVAPPPPPVAPTTVPTRSLQVLSYVARAPGRTAITLRYVRIGAGAEVAPPTVTFTVEVPVPPPLF